MSFLFETPDVSPTRVTESRIIRGYAYSSGGIYLMKENPATVTYSEL